MKLPRLTLVVAAALLTGVPGTADKSIQVSEKALRDAAQSKPEPEYPALARQIRVQGDVILEVIVDQAGSVDKISVLRGNSLLSSSCVQAVKKWRFHPLKAEGLPARAVGTIKFSFHM